MLSFAPDAPIGPERFYREMSPQLAARLRQLWSARGHDLDRIWVQCIRTLPGFCPLPAAVPAPDSRAHDGLCLFDQALIWLTALNRAMAAGAHTPRLELSAEQLQAGAVLSGRMVETLAAIRQLILSGLTLPALQLARSVSEDVDMALALLLRRRLAGQFLDCRSAEEANEFWRRHVAGGRAFRLVAEKLYAIGLDHTDASEYGRWRRGVLTLLGSAIHSSPLGRPVTGQAGGWPADPVAQDCLQFVTHRLHELCAWAHLLDIGLNADLARIAAAHPDGAAADLLVYAATSREILLDQLRWTVAGPGARPGQAVVSAGPGPP